MKKLTIVVALAMIFAGCEKKIARMDMDMDEPPPADCMIDAGPCVKTLDGGFKVVFDAVPKPVKAMAELAFSVELTSSTGPITDAKVALDFSMPNMNMGENRPAMAFNASTGKYEGKGTLPTCMHGGKTWKAIVEFESGGAKREASFIFNLAE